MKISNQRLKSQHHMKKANFNMTQPAASLLGRRESQPLFTRPAHESFPANCLPRRESSPLIFGPTCPRASESLSRPNDLADRLQNLKTQLLETRSSSLGRAQSSVEQYNAPPMLQAAVSNPQLLQMHQLQLETKHHYQYLAEEYRTRFLAMEKELIRSEESRQMEVESVKRELNRKFTATLQQMENSHIY